jgi:hypothetical protein
VICPVTQIRLPRSEVSGVPNFARFSPYTTAVKTEFGHGFPKSSNVGCDCTLASYSAEAAPPQRYQDFIERGPASFKPTTPPIAGFELTVMADTIGKLVEDEITPVDADVVVSALAR